MKLKLLTSLLLIVSTLFFVANANARISPSPTVEKQMVGELKERAKRVREKERQKRRVIEDKCIAKAGKMNNEFAAKKLYKSCLADEGL